VENTLECYQAQKVDTESRIVKVKLYMPLATNVLAATGAVKEAAEPSEGRESDDILGRAKVQGAPDETTVHRTDT